MKYYVEVGKDMHERETFIKNLESKGFEIEEKYSRKGILKNVLPITVDLENKLIGRIGNVTCACVASKNGMIMHEEEFWNHF